MTLDATPVPALVPVSDAALRRVRRALGWLTMASVVAVLVPSAAGSASWTARGSWAFAAMVAADLVVGVPIELVRIRRAWTARRRAIQALHDARDELVATRRAAGAAQEVAGGIAHVIRVDASS